MSNIHLLFYAIILVFECISYSSQQACNVLVKDLTRKQPLIVQNYGTPLKLWIPVSPTLKTSMTFVCSGSANNKIAGTNDAKADLTCSGQSFFYQTLTFSATSLVCDYLITGDIETTATPCANGLGTISKIGFRYGPNRDWIDFFEVCYSQLTANNIYSKHVLWGYSLQYKQTNPAIPEFKSARSATSVSSYNAYLTSTQQTVFQQLFGATLGNNYLNYNQGKYLAKGHMTPNADFPLIPLQFATYFFVNVAPHWQAVNNNNWKRVEDKVRRAAIGQDTSFDVYTGTQGILKLPDANGNPVEVFLVPSQRSIAVPEYLWKVVYNDLTDEAIAFVTLNNPYATVAPNLMCADQCAVGGWSAVEFSVLAKGFTYCCKVDDLRRSIPTVPQLQITGLLHA